jgi:tetratricopeptide (TPR) repeat protein
LGNDKEAIEDFDKVIILDARISTAYVYRGLCRMKGGEYQEALTDYQKALEFSPKDASIHNNLAWLYATAKEEKFQDKLKALEHAVKAAELSNEKNAEILDTLAKVYLINGKVNEAIEAEKKALKLEPNNERLKENLKKYEKAIKKD